MNNVYGTKKPANISSSDVDIFYHYRPNRNSDDPDFATFKKLHSSDVESMLFKTSAGTLTGETTEMLPGMYDLHLPLDKFSKKGIYTIYIKPKEILTEIIDVSTLAAYPDVRGIVIDSSEVNGSNINGSLVGYRVEYFNDNGRSEDFRIITSNNKCEPVAQNLTDSTQKGIRYRFNESSNLVFCTLTPSIGPSFKATNTPLLGNTGEQIAIINTKFNPFMIEVEMVEHDEETISTMLEGDQIRNLEKGTITTFTESGGIYHQSRYGTAVDPDTGKAHDFRINNRGSIDNNEQTVMNDLKNES